MWKGGGLSARTGGVECGREELSAEGSLRTEGRS